MTAANATGFNGLLSRLTDADTAIAEADRLAARPRQSETAGADAGSTAPVEPDHRDNGALVSGLKKVGGWALAIVMIVAIKGCLYGGLHALTDGGSSDTSASSDVVEMGNDAATPQAVDTSAYAPLAQSDDASESAPAASEEDSDPSVMTQPSAGNATLTMPELRWCLAEDIRLSAEKSEMESVQYLDPDKFNRNVDAFNEAVNDYNSSCGDRSIIASERPIATAQVEDVRSSLEAEGRNRVN
jgi:hypothetical protein